MANIVNQYGQVKLGVRYTSAPLTSTLWGNVFGVWNADALGTSLDASIRAAYNAENNANDALGAYNGTEGGTLTYSTGKIGNAFDFNGTNAFVELPENTLSLSTNFALSFWMYTIANGTTSVISNFGNDGINRGFYIDQDGSNSLRFVAFNNTPTIVTSGTGTIQLNQWQHFVFNCNAGVGQWYINGSSIGSPTNISPTYISNSKPLIGAYRSGNTGGKSSYRNMKLDAFTAWNKALTAGEISSLYNGGLGAEYPFASQTLSTTADAVGSNHGIRPSSTLTGGVPGPSFTTGKIGKAFTFDGINDYIALPDNSLNFTGPFSYSFWIKATDTTGYTVIVGNIQGARAPYGFGHGYNFWLQYGKITIGFRNGMDSPSYGLDSVATVANGLWNHVVITYKYTPVNTDGAKIYINGVLDSSRSVPNSTNFYSSPMKACIGARNQAGAPEYFLSNGTSLDAMSVWNKELSASEITELYNSGNGKQYPN